MYQVSRALYLKLKAIRQGALSRFVFSHPSVTVARTGLPGTRNLSHVIGRSSVLQSGSTGGVCAVGTDSSGPSRPDRNLMYCDAEIIITIIDFLILSLFFIHCTSVYRDIEDGLCMSVA